MQTSVLRRAAPSTHVAPTGTDLLDDAAGEARPRLLHHRRMHKLAPGVGAGGPGRQAQGGRRGGGGIGGLPPPGARLAGRSLRPLSRLQLQENPSYRGHHQQRQGQVARRAGAGLCSECRSVGSECRLAQGEQRRAATAELPCFMCSHSLVSAQLRTTTAAMSLQISGRWRRVGGRCGAGEGAAFIAARWCGRTAGGGGGAARSWLAAPGAPLLHSATPPDRCEHAGIAVGAAGRAQRRAAAECSRVFFRLRPWWCCLCSVVHGDVNSRAHRTRL